MNFASGTFFLFLILLLAVYWALPSHRARKVLLLGASYYFYMSWNIRFAGLILFSTLIDYACGRIMAGTDETRTRRIALILSCTVNLGLLAYFKYAGFFIESLVDLLQSIGFSPGLAELNILLPVGISFYTFQSMSYTIDLYRRQIPLCRDFLDFSLFVAFFPQLVAGPIVRAAHFLPQLLVNPAWNTNQFYAGLYRVIIGLAKKVILADTFARIANPVFAQPEAFHSGAVWLGVIAFGLQIFYDFSAYSDIAIGSARMLGYQIPENFNFPYLAKSMREFWTRWHISLSTWLRDYLYIPLGGNRQGTFLTYRNLIITMILGGLWHGAAWTFVAWGAFHGLLLAFNHRFRFFKDPGPAVSILCMLLTLVCTCIGWLLFRATNFGEAMTLLGRMFLVLPGGGPVYFKPAIGWLFAFVFLRHVVAAFPEGAFNRLLERPGVRITIASA